MEITVEIRHEYGHERVYPVCPTAKLFQKLTSNKSTLGMQDIDIIKQLGYSIVVQQAKRVL